MDAIGNPDRLTFPIVVMYDIFLFSDKYPYLGDRREARVRQFPEGIVKFFVNFCVDRFPVFIFLNYHVERLILLFIQEKKKWGQSVRSDR